jgi:Cu(I)/Ag(I) efflux system membrane fusion protein
MKRAIVSVVWALLICLAPAVAFDVLAAGSGGSATSHAREAGEGETAVWTCGMHPSVRMNEPGKCPICNMDLVPVQEGQGEGAGGPVTVQLGERARSLAGVATSDVRFLPLFKEIRAAGSVDYDERRVAAVTARVAGRIDKLFVDFTGAAIARGEPLVHLYSPDFVATQDEYLLALNLRTRVTGSTEQSAVQSARSLTEAARRRLLLWGITERQIAELEAGGRSSDHVAVVSPISGTVIRKMAVAGAYVKEGDHLYDVADLSNVWVYADIYESEMPWVRVGQDVHVTTVAHPGEMFHGTVAFIDPFLHERTRSVKVRIDIPNPDMKLKPGMFVDVVLRGSLDEGTERYVCPMHPEIVTEEPGDCPICGMHLVKTPTGVELAVPKSAILDTGKRTLVYVEKEPGRYEARDVVVGPQATADLDGGLAAFYPVRKGLMEGERVVTRGNFLIDSQSQLTAPAASMYDAALGAEEATPPVHRH